MIFINIDIMKLIMKQFLLLLIIGLVGCTAAHKNVAKIQTLDFSGLNTLVYKTKANYENRVPVLLSEDKSRIVFYPAPKDVYFRGELAKPTKLSKGYWLDNRGINENVAFTKYTYEEYSQLKEAPPLDTLFNKIIDKNPLTDLCNCGNRKQFADDNTLKVFIRKRLSECKRIK